MTNLYNWIFDQELDLNKEILSTQSGRFTYKDIRQGVEEDVCLLESLGEIKNKRVAVIVPSVFNFITLVLAISKLGGVAIPVSPLLRKEDLVSVLDFVDPHIVFTAIKHNGFELGDNVCNWADSSYKETIIFKENEITNWYKLKISGEPRSLEESNIQIIGCTTGSTGTPKGVVVNVDYFRRAEEALSFSLDLSGNDKLFLAGPAIGLYGLCFLLSSLRSGYHLVVTESFNFPEIIKLLEQQPSNKLMTTPSLFKAIDLFNRSLGKNVLKPIKLLCIGGEAVTEEFIQTYINLPLKMMNLYGLTEWGPVLYSEDDIRTNEELTLIPNVSFKLNSESNKELGELLLKTSNPFLGYYKRSDLTEEVYKNGWYYTGDLAEKTDDSKIKIIGRKKDVIKKGGQQVLPGEIEKFLRSHPKVQKAVVVGIPHPVFGEQIIAFVHKEDELEKNTLFEYCNNRIARYKIPDQIEFIEEFPMLQGKIDRVTLRRTAIANGYFMKSN